jgi:5-methylcytosine-specific restriction endonuclease McrA
MIVRHLKEVLQGKTQLLKKRSSRWKKVRTEFLKGKRCAACGGVDYLEAHHIVPFHQDPSKELDPTNLIALCDRPGRSNCHLDIGHLGNWKRENPHVQASADQALRKKLKTKSNVGPNK